MPGGRKIHGIEFWEKAVPFPQVGSVPADQTLELHQSRGQPLDRFSSFNLVADILQQIRTGLFTLKNRGFTPFFGLQTHQIGPKSAFRQRNLGGKERKACPTRPFKGQAFQPEMVGSFIEGHAIKRGGNFRVRGENP